MIKNLLSNIIDTEVKIMVFTIGNICKEIQRIQFDLEKGDVDSAIDRCENLDSLLCDIEDGSVELEHYNINNHDSINSRNAPSQEYIDFLQAEIPEKLWKKEKQYDKRFLFVTDNGLPTFYDLLRTKIMNMNETEDMLNALEIANKRYGDWVGSLKREDIDTICHMSIYEIMEGLEYYKNRVKELEKKLNIEHEVKPNVVSLFGD